MDYASYEPFNGTIKSIAKKFKYSYHNSIKLEVEDLIQEANLALCKAVPTQSEINELYVTKIARRAMYRYLEQEARMLGVTIYTEQKIDYLLKHWADKLQDYGAKAVAYRPRTGSPEAETPSVEEELLEYFDLKAAMECLPMSHQTILYMTYYEKKSQRTIAEELGVDQKTVSRRAVKAEQALWREMQHISGGTDEQ